MFTSTKEAHAVDTFVFICFFLLFVVAAFVATVCTMSQYWIGTLFGFAIMGVCAFGMHALNISINR